MTRIGTADQVLLLLRERLQRGGRAEKSGRSVGVTGTQRIAPRPLERARALTELEALSEDERRRAVIRGLLADEFGETVANDPGFQSVIDQVVRIIRDAPGGDALFDQAIAELRAG